MENHKKDNKGKVADSEGYDVKNPQNEDQPIYNSTTTHRDGAGLPSVENLNQTSGLKDELKKAKKNNSAPSAPRNDSSLHGEGPKTDLGNGQRDEDEDEDEKIIRR